VVTVADVVDGSENVRPGPASATLRDPFVNVATHTPEAFRKTVRVGCVSTEAV